MRRILAATVIVSSILLTGCATVETAKAELPAAATFEILREAYTRNTNVCVQNNTPMRMRIQWRGYPASLELGSGRQQCNSGHDILVWDVLGMVRYEPVDQLDTWYEIKVSANNTMIDPPQGAAWFESGDKQFGACGYFGESDFDSLQVDNLRIYIERMGDSANDKEFVVVLTAPSGSNYAADVSDCVNKKMQPKD